MTKLKPPFRDSGLPTPVGRSSYDAEARRAETPASLPSAPPCPFCDGTETEIMSPFGSHASLTAYWCRACGSPFEMMKWKAR